MELSKGIFAVKLYELERKYEQMQARLTLCQHMDHESIQNEIRQMLRTGEEDSIRLQKSIDYCHSPAVAALGQIQKEYLDQTKKLLDQQMLTYMQSETCSEKETLAEGSLLYAEYAIDFAVQAMDHALLSALCAIDRQLTLEEGEKTNE